jgi:hypothetical protein
MCDKYDAMAREIVTKDAPIHHGWVKSFMADQDAKLAAKLAVGLRAVAQESADEITRLREQLKIAVWADSEECRMLEKENERLLERIKALEDAVMPLWGDLPYDDAIINLRRVLSARQEVSP